MSVYEIRTLACGSCGSARPVKVADSANPVRHPPFLDDLLDRRFHRFPCRACGHVDVVDGPLLWTDVPHGLVVWVMPDSERLGWVHTEQFVEEGLRGPVTEEGPAIVRAWGARAARRLVFGLEELREKVVAARHGLDDRAVEALKVPHADRSRAVAPTLEQVDGDGLRFCWPPGEHRRDLWIPRSDHDDALHALDATPDAFAGLLQGTWVHWSRSVFPPLAAVG